MIVLIMMAKRASRALLLFTLVQACSDDPTGGTQQPVSLAFAVEVNGAPFVCGSSYPRVGTPASAYTITDARFYVYDVALLDTSGIAHPVTLDGNAYQGQGIGLLDFEDGCGSDGTPQTHTALTGTVAAGTYTGIRYTVGVPPAKNFIDLASAAPPLDVTGMFWIWQFGYKFFKVDGSAVGTGGTGESFFVHIGASGCPGTNFQAPPTGPCAFPNRVTYTLTGFTPGTNKVVADLGTVLAASDLTVNTADTAPGCMSEPADPECITVMPRMGVNGAADQVLFKVK